ncbi:MAG: zinc-dependent alcohol dehydrogenase [Chloroflexota bacterium]
MKAVQLQGPGQIVFGDVPSKPLGPGEVRIRIASSGICGSDMAALRGANPFMRFPVIPGHELSGTVAEVSAGSQFAVGQRVYARPLASCGQCRACLAKEWNHCLNLTILGVHVDGAYAEEVVVPEAVVRALPESMSFDDGAMVEPTAVAVHSTNRSMLRPGESVAVLGAGVIGNLIVQMTKVKGAGLVMATDVVDERLALARQMGADLTANVSREDPVQVSQAHIDGFDVIFDLAGPRHTMTQAIAMARPGGRIVMLVPPETPTLEIAEYNALFRKELTLRWTRVYDADFDDAAPLIAQGKIDVKSLVTHSFPLDQYEKAIETVRSKTDNAIKVMLHC